MQTPHTPQCLRAFTNAAVCSDLPRNKPKQHRCFFFEKKKKKKKKKKKEKKKEKKKKKKKKTKQVKRATKQEPQGDGEPKKKGGLSPTHVRDSELVFM